MQGVFRQCSWKLLVADKMARGLRLREGHVDWLEKMTWQIRRREDECFEERYGPVRRGFGLYIKKSGPHVRPRAKDLVSTFPLRVREERTVSCYMEWLPFAIFFFSHDPAHPLLFGPLP